MIVIDPISAYLGKTDSHSNAEIRALLHPLAKLAGEWCEEGSDKVAVSYAVTAGGSVLVETLFPGTKMEMLTLYHVDGKDLVLTHYCMLGNQPKMKAAEKFDGASLAWTCTSVSNAASHDEPHMHSLVMTLTDDDHLKHSWGMCEKGKETGKKEFSLVRRKK